MFVYTQQCREGSTMNKEDISIAHYRPFLGDIKKTITEARIRVIHAANNAVIQLYRKIGEKIVLAQQDYGWGKSVVEHLSKDLRQEFGSTFGFSVQNLWYMRQFFLEYKDQPILQRLVGEIPWGQNILIMAKVKDLAARKYYLINTQKMGWTRDVLSLQIGSQAYERHCLIPKQNNFEKALPKHLVEQAQDCMKDVYMLDMLGITKTALEVEIESRMVSKIKDVMLELGFGFAYIGNQYRIACQGKEYFIDLLFTNRKLHCLVALEIKKGKFLPEYAGKMNFYLNLLDDFVRVEGENPSVGIILCTERDHFEVEYALRGIDKPVGVSGFQLTKDLPAALRDKLPNAKSLEKELIRELYGMDDKQEFQKETEN